MSKTFMDKTLADIQKRINKKEEKLKKKIEQKTGKKK